MTGRKPRTRFDLLVPDISRTVLQQQNKQRGYLDRTAQYRTLLVGDAVFARNYVRRWFAMAPRVHQTSSVDGPVSY